MNSVSRVIVEIKPAIQIPAPARIGTTTINTAALVSPDIILITTNESSKGAARIMIRPIMGTYHFLIPIFGW